LPYASSAVAPARGNTGVQRPGEHILGEHGLGRELDFVGNRRFPAAVTVAGPGLRQIQLAVDQRASFACGVSKKHAQLTVLDTPGGTGILPLHTRGLGALLEKSGLVDHEYPVPFAEVLHRIGTYVITHTVGVPHSGVEQTLHPVRGQLTGGLGQRPAVLARQRRQQTTHIGAATTSWLDPQETARDPRKQLIQASDPCGQVVITQHKINNLHEHDHEVLLEY
jgi:hypothetical protein